MSCDDEARLRTHCPDCRLPPERRTRLVAACVCVHREQLFSSATRGGQRETRTSYSCGPGACGNRGLSNMGEERGGWGRAGGREDESDSTGKR